MEGDSRNPRVSLLKKYDIPIDHLSFEYIESCKDKKELERIVRILRSGEEGTYPDLIKTAENQLRQIAPNSRVLRVETPVLRKESFSSEEWKKFEKELLSWEEEMNIMDKGLEFEKRRFDTIGNKNLPDIRKALDKKPDKKMKKEAESTKIKIETNTKNERIKSGDYAAWDKFDVDKELLKMDLEDERNEERNAKLKREMEKQKKLNQEKKIEPLNINTDSYTNTEQQVLANQAKDRGNECYKSGDYDNALKYYNVSLKLCPTPNAYNNRAMTYIKIKNYEAALKDCNEVLKMEQNNVKALHRRATAYQNLPGENTNELALKDLLKIISLEPTNRVAQSDLQALKKKLNMQDNEKKFRMMIEESGSEELKEFFSKPSYLERKSYWSDNDNITAVHKLPLTYYGPSTSTFQCEPQSMTHRMLSGPTFNGQVMCKCNSNATRQNPLCHRCGERLSQPKKKSKLVVKKEPAVQFPAKSEVNALNEGIKESESKAVKGEKRDIKEVDNMETPAIKLQEDIKIPQVDNETKSKSTINEENEKSKLILAEPNSIKNSDCKDNDKEIKPTLDSMLNEKSEKREETIMKVLENNTYKEEKEELKKVEMDLKESDQRLEVNKGIEAADTGKEEQDKNHTLFRELDMSLKERKNINNEQYKDLSLEITDEGRNSTDNKKSENCVPKADDDTSPKVNKSDDQNDNRCLPSTSSQNQSKSETRKRKKKRRSKEPRQDELRMRYHEPVKIVQATKYLKPTSSEPKPEIENFKDGESDKVVEQKNQFKNFVPSKTSLTAKSGVLTSSAPSYMTNTKERDYKENQIYSQVERVERHYEGNKENIENGRDRNPFETLKGYVEDKGNMAMSSFEFMKSWESMKKTDESYEKRAEIVRLLRPQDLMKVIGNNLDSDMLKSLLECLEKHFLESDPNKVTSILRELPGIPRFSIVNLFLSPDERKVIERLIECTEKKGFVLEEEIKSSLKISF